MNEEELPEEKAVTGEDFLAGLKTPDPTFTVEVQGNPITFRRPHDVQELEKIGKQAVDFFKMTQKAPPKDMLPYLPITETTAIMASFLIALAVRPKFTHVQALMLARKHGAILVYLYEEIKAGIGAALVKGEVEQIDTAKNA